MVDEPAGTQTAPRQVGVWRFASPRWRERSFICLKRKESRGLACVRSDQPPFKGARRQNPKKAIEARIGSKKGGRQRRDPFHVPARKRIGRRYFSEGQERREVPGTPLEGGELSRETDPDYIHITCPAGHGWTNWKEPLGKAPGDQGT